MKKNSLLRNAFLTFAGILLFFTSISCEIGMGESIDLTPPVLKIVSPQHGALTPQNVILTGIAVDDRKLYSVEVKYKYRKDGQEVSGSKMAMIVGSTWICDFMFDGDYEVEFEAYAYDARRNGSDTSHDRIMILIDSECPGITKMSIERGYYVARIIPLEEFTREGDGKEAKKNDSLNKDYFQNEEIIIHSNLSDKYGIGDVFLDLYEVNPNTLSENLIVSNITPCNDTNVYSPNFKITEGMLSMLPRDKITYIKPHLRVKDIAGNFSDKTNGVFAWYPDYNTPHISFNTYDIGYNEIRVQQGAPIIVSMFDDDDLKYYDCWLVRKTGDSIDVDSVTSKTKVATQTFNERGMRSTSFEVGTATGDTDSDGNPVALGQYWLVIKAVDDSTTDRGRSDGTYFKATPVRVTNQDAPSIFVTESDFETAAEENVIPTLDADGKFTLNGYVIDNESSGIKIAIAWLGPEVEGQSRKQIADGEAYFNNYNFNASAGDLKTSGNMKIWKMADQTSTAYGTDRYKYTFTKDFNFFDDFKIDGNVDKTAKVFMIAAKDGTGNITTKTFRFNKMSSTIYFEVKHGDKIDENPLVVLKDPDTSVNFEITPKNKNGIKIVESTVTESSGSVAINKTNQTHSFSLSGGSGQKYEFELSAKDALGYEQKQKLTVLFDTPGVLQSINCNRNPNDTFISGETITLQANFNKKVTLHNMSADNTQKPYIELNGTNFKNKDGSSVTAENRRAYLKTDGLTNMDANTLYFEYKVPDDIEATNLTINKIIIPKKASIYGTIGTKTEIKDPSSGEVLREEHAIDNAKNHISGATNKQYNIDSILPYIVGMTPNNGNAKKAEMNPAGDEAQDVEIEIEFNEPVYVASGTITMQRTANWYIPPILSEEVFLKIYNDKNTTATQKVNLCGSSTNHFKYVTNTLIPEGPYMRYTNGLDMSGTYAEPDINTKYVLAYNLNINGTDDKVKNIRAALEARDYHKAEIDVSMSAVTGSGTNKIKVKVDKDYFTGGLVYGVEYFLSITPESFRDAANNYYKKGLASNATNNKVAYNNTTEGNVADYKFWVGPVAKPVIRVNRTATNAYNAKPTGKTDIKIDCETPGATLNYGRTPETSGTYVKNGSENKSYSGVETVNNYGDRTDITNATVGTVKTITVDSKGTINGTMELKNAVGDGKYTTAEKIYMRAYATKTAMGVDSEYKSPEGYEGAFKTVLHTVDPNYYKYNYTNTLTKQPDSVYKGTDFRVYGTQTPEGSSFTAGWPLTQNGPERKDYQVAWQEATNTSSYYWVSWQILTPFTMQSFLGVSPNQEHANTYCTYGQYVYYYRMNYW